MESSLVPLVAQIERANARTITCIAFHPTATPPILAANCQYSVELWRFSSDGAVGSGTNVCTLKPEYPKYFSAIAFHPTANPAILAAGGFDLIKLWRVLISPDGSVSGEELIRFENSSNSLAFHPTQPFLVAGGRNEIKLWYLTKPLAMWQDDKRYDVTIPGLNTDATSPSWTHLPPPKRPKPSMTSMIKTNPITLTSPNTDSVAFPVAFHPTECLLACCDRNTLKLWSFSPDIREEPKLTSLVCCQEGDYGNYAKDVAFHPTANILVAAQFGSIQIWARSTGGLWNIQSMHVVPHLKCIAFHPTAPVLAISGSTFDLMNVSVDGVDLITRVMQNGEVYSVAFHPTLPLLATNSTIKSESNLKLWDCMKLSARWQRNKSLQALGGLATTLSLRFGTDSSKHHSDETRGKLSAKLSKAVNDTSKTEVRQLTNEDLLKKVMARLKRDRPPGGGSRRRKIKTKQKYSIKYNKKYSKRNPIKNKNKNKK